MELIERMRFIAEIKAKSERSFAITIGINQPTVHNYMTGKRQPSLEFILATLATYPDVSAEWLLRGEGTMQKESASTVITNDNRRTITKINGNNVVSDHSSLVVSTPADNRDRIIKICEELLLDDSVDKNRVLDLLAKAIS